MCNVIKQVLSLYTIEYVKNENNDISHKNGDITNTITFFNNSTLYKIKTYEMNGFNNSKYFGMLVLQPNNKMIHTKKDSIRYLFEILR